MLEVGRLGAGQDSIPFRFLLDNECTTRLATNDSAHFLALSIDKGPALISAMVDGMLCDGGGHQAQGWVAMPRGTDDPLRYVDGWMAADAAGVVGPAAVALRRLVVMDRYLLSTEMLGTYRAWRNEATA